MPPLSYAIALLIGPKQQEIDRSNDLLESLGAHEPNPAAVAVVDDCPQPRDLSKLLHFPSQLTPTFLRFERPKVHFNEAKGVCGNSMMAFSWIAKHAPMARFGMKLDTDALVIGPFAEKLAGQFDADPSVGALGAYTKTPEGFDRDISRNARLMRELHRPSVRLIAPPRQVWRAIRRRFMPDPAVALIRRHLSDAVANGYVYGENCLGGGYAMSRESLAEMNRRGYLDDHLIWAGVDVPEEVMMCMYVRATGKVLKNHVDRNEVFGVRFVGLPFDLPELLERGYSIIHSVKNDNRHTEDQVRQFFKSRRAAAPASAG